MAKLIKQIYDLVVLATDKGITGYHSDSQIMDAIHEGQMVLWRQLIKKFPQDKRVRNDLIPLQIESSILLSGGIGAIPDDFEQEIEAWAYNAGNTIKRQVKFVEQGFWYERRDDPVDTPSLDHPIARIYGSSGSRIIEVYPPASPPQVALTYWRAPVKPVFSTIESGGTYIYNDATSTDVEWRDSLHDILVRNALGRLGLNLKDGQIQAAGAAVEPKEATI